MAGNTSQPGATVVSRTVALLTAFDDTHPRLTRPNWPTGPASRSPPRTGWSAS